MYDFNNIEGKFVELHYKYDHLHSNLKIHTHEIIQIKSISSHILTP